MLIAAKSCTQWHINMTANNVNKYFTRSIGGGMFPLIYQYMQSANHGMKMQENSWALKMSFSGETHQDLFEDQCFTNNSSLEGHKC